MTVPALLRVLVLVALAAALLLPAPAAEGPAPVVWVDAIPGSVVGDDVAPTRGSTPRLLASPRAPGLVVRADTTPPSAETLTLLEAAARRAPIVAVIPEGVRPLHATPPVRLTAERTAAIGFSLTGTPGGSVRVRLLDAAGPMDSVTVTVGADGTVAGAFRVRPAREGWQAWTVEAHGDTVPAGAWAEPARPPRVLVAAGAPSWESRFVLRALEEAGATVDVVHPLGRGLAVGREAIPTAASALDRFDAVIVLPGARVDAPRRRALAEFAARGGGVLVVGDDALAAALAVSATGSLPAETPASAITWDLPAELSPLPNAEVRVPVRTLGALRPGTVAAATVDGAPVLALRPFGRGRAAALGLVETWPWRMEAGRVTEHRAFWHGLVEWLAAGTRGNITLELPSPAAPTGEPVTLRVHGASPDARLVLTRPGGATDTLTLGTDRAGALVASFLPTEPGPHRLSLGDDALVTFVSTETPAPAPDGWARLALLAHRTGGEVIRVGQVEQRIAAWEADRNDDSPDPRAILLTIAALLTVAEWTARRMTGRA